MEGKRKWTRGRGRGGGALKLVRCAQLSIEANTHFIEVQQVSSHANIDSSIISIMSRLETALLNNDRYKQVPQDFSSDFLFTNFIHPMSWQ